MMAYTSKYGTYPNCYFRVGKYLNGNLAIEIWSNEEGPIVKVTINPDIKIPKGYIAIKNYSENEGMVEWLQSTGIIVDEPTQIIRSGFIEIPVYALTEYGKDILR